MTTAIESGVGDVWQVKQDALGTIEPVATAAQHLRKDGEGALKAAKTYGSKEWADGKQFGSPSMFVDTIGGDVGSVVHHAQIANTGFCFAQIIGVDVVTGTDPNYTHTIASGTANGPYQTFRQKVGVAVGPWRTAYWDALINKMAWNCSQDDKTATIEQNVHALHAGDWQTGDPEEVDDGTDPFNWNEAGGAATTKVDSTALPEVDGETLEIDRKLDVHRGEGPAPICFLPGKGEMNRSFTALATDTTIPLIKTALYGTASPTDGQAVSNTVNYVALETLYTRDVNRSLKITTPKVAVDPADFEIAPRAEGGKIPITFGGRCFDSGATPMLTVVAKTGDADSYV